jgi:hypothetical protein
VNEEATPLPVEAVTRPAVFVIMAFDPELEKVYTELIRDPLEREGFAVQRADSIAEQRNILKDIVRGIVGANLVVADLTGLNPNVFYELGIAHALRKPTVVITQSVDDMPFDLRSYRVVAYSLRFDEAPKLSEKLIAIGRKLASGEALCENPITDFGTPQTADVAATPETVGPYRRASTERSAERGMLDFLADGLTSLEQVANSSVALTACMQRMGSKTENRTSEIEAAKRCGGSTAIVRMRDIARAQAQDLVDFAESASGEESKLRAAWEAVADNTSAWLQRVVVTKGEEEEATRKFREQVSGLQVATASGVAGVRSFRKATEGGRGMSADLNRAIDITLPVLDRLIAALELGDSACSRIITILDDKLQHLVELPPLQNDKKSDAAGGMLPGV